MGLANPAIFGPDGGPAPAPSLICARQRETAEPCGICGSLPAQEQPATVVVLTDQPNYVCRSKIVMPRWKACDKGWLSRVVVALAGLEAALHIVMGFGDPDGPTQNLPRRRQRAI